MHQLGERLYLCMAMLNDQVSVPGVILRLHVTASSWLFREAAKLCFLQSLLSLNGIKQQRRGPNEKFILEPSFLADIDA